MTGFHCVFAGCVWVCMACNACAVCRRWVGAQMGRKPVSCYINTTIIVFYNQIGLTNHKYNQGRTKLGKLGKLSLVHPHPTTPVSVSYLSCKYHKIKFCNQQKVKAQIFKTCCKFLFLSHNGKTTRLKAALINLFVWTMHQMTASSENHHS